MKLPSIQWDRNSAEAPLKQLVRLVEQKQYQDRPSIPPHAKKKPVFRENNANELTKSIIAFFEVIGGHAERINSMGRQLIRDGKPVWVKGAGTDGTADISATWAGRSIKIEVKATKGEKQSDKQKQYQERIEQAGGIYLIARNMDGFIYMFFKAVEVRSNEG
ncbi:hypothetical protein J2X69_002685 [Algoriphagus sp. 4150]|uniref:hypothetical protein n=1 Tax=Algoriphagus sp. 4150 TaxID=2817756 RepID=UPI00285F1D42|nr:hypothetical protein [Algoriphagus sp. 4150]MDR7130335.1 hypothetical protein [Algoriphagus sp. 4150]